MSHKDRQIIILVEAEIKELIADLASSDGKSLSAVIRSLIVKELVDRKLLTEQTLRSIVG